MPFYLDVLPATPIPGQNPQVFTWRSPKLLPKGAVVRAPFRSRTVFGMVMGESERVFRGHIRDIASVVSATPFFSQASERFFLWLVHSTVTPPSIVLSRFFPAWLKSLEGVAVARPKHVFSQKFVFAASYAKRRKVLAGVLQKYSNAQTLIVVPESAAAKELSLLFAREGLPGVKNLVGVSQAVRRKIWGEIRAGVPGIFVGVTDAFFLPFSDLRAVAVIDEANPLYRFGRKAPNFHARDAARVLAEQTGALLLLEGFLPSLEIFAQHLGITIPTMASAFVVDMRRTRRGLLFGIDTVLSINKALAKSGKVLFFVSRKGTAPFMMCANCGKSMICGQCEAPMPYFKSNTTALLRCRHCGNEFPPPMACPFCQSWSVRPRGIGAAGVADAAKRLFPGVRVLRMDSEVTPNAVQQKEVLDELRNQKKAVLVATPMAFGKFLPPCDVVCVVAADQMLAIPDFDAEERLFATVARLRGLLKPKGKLYIQTWQAENEAMQAAAKGDFLEFAHRELGLRKDFGWPPYRRIAKLTFRHRSKEHAQSESERLGKVLKTVVSSIPRTLSLEVMGPNPAFISKIRGKYIFNVLLKWKPRGLEDVRVEKQLLEIVPRNWRISINPESIL